LWSPWSPWQTSSSRRSASVSPRCGSATGAAAATWGPWSPGAPDKVAGYIDIAKADGAAVVVDGRGISVDGDPNGFWLGPTLLDDVPVTSRAYTEEIFGPVLSVVRVSSLDEAITLVNAGAYGNGTAIFTRNGGAARQFRKYIQAGMIGINVPIPCRSPRSRSGMEGIPVRRHQAHGAEGVRFFTQMKAVTSRCPTSAGRAQPRLPGKRLTKGPSGHGSAQ